MPASAKKRRCGRTCRCAPASARRVQSAEPPGGLKLEVARIDGAIPSGRRSTAQVARWRGRTLAVAVGMEEAPAVVVADQRQDAGRRRAARRDIRPCGRVSRHKRAGVGQDAVEQKEIQRVDVVVGGLLEVAAVLANLARHRARRSSAPAVRQPRAAIWGTRPERVERHRLAQQVRVGREIDGEVVLQEIGRGGRVRSGSARGVHGGISAPARCTDHVQESARKATSSALAQLMPRRNGLASSQLAAGRRLRPGTRAGR